MSFFQKPYFFVNMVPRILFILLSQVLINGCLILSVLIYIHIYIVIRRRSASFALSNTTTTQELRTLQQTKKITHMTALTFLAFLIVWLPYSIVADVKPSIGMTSAEGAIIFQILVYFTLGNSFFNMFIYAHQSKPFRKAFADMLCLKKGNSNNQTRETAFTTPVSVSAIQTCND